MNSLRSTTFWAIVPSHTDAAMNSTSATIAPMPGDVVHRTSLEPPEPAAVTLRHDPPPTLVTASVSSACSSPKSSSVITKYDRTEAQPRAHRPRHDNAPENPIGKPQHIRQRRRVAAVAQTVTNADRIDAGATSQIASTQRSGLRAGATWSAQDLRRPLDSSAATLQIADHHARQQPQSSTSVRGSRRPQATSVQ